jgi:ferric-dicitrate binding protein FerR (iron transport regulator)
MKNNLWNLIAGKLHHELDEQERRELEKLIQDGEGHAILKRTQEIYSALINTSRLRHSNKNKSWQAIHKKIRLVRVYQVTRQFIKVAAVIIFAFLLGNLYSTHFKKQDIQYTEIEVMNGQTSHLFLFDGTEVWLNSGTRFKYPNRFNDTERKVYINGEAYFKVKPSNKLPFKVETGRLEVEVLGTAFNVTAYQDEAVHSVVLVEGSVQLNNPNGKKIGEMKPGQIANQTAGNRITLDRAELYLHTSWKDGKVTFSGEQLVDIAKKMERWYNVEIRFEMSSLENYQFSGTILRNKPIDQTLKALELLAPVHFNYQVRANMKDLITIEKR